MLQITKTIPVHLDIRSNRLVHGPGQSLSLEQVSMKLWVTYQGTTDRQSGMIVNVSDIKKVLFDQLSQKEVIVHHAVGILRQVWGIMEDKIPDCSLVRLALDIHDSLRLSINTEDQNMIHITTKYELAASHRLKNPQWDEQKNRKIFGKCSNPAGHGHNYLLEVTVSGEPDAQTGQIVNIGNIDNIVKKYIIQPFDHKNLNQDIPEFREQLPTVENMAKIFWEKLQGRFGEVKLHRIRIWETRNTYADYFG